MRDLNATDDPVPSAPRLTPHGASVDCTPSSGLTSALLRGVDASHPSQLGDRYLIEEPIGYGGMGRVYRAHDTLLDRKVAVKLLDEAVIDNGDLAGAPLAEARAVAKLAHPGIIHVFDVGVQDGTCYVVMELVPGRTLHELVRERGLLPPAEAVDIAAQVADALDDAHQHGVVHCDVKPQNIIVTPEGRAKLVDFGIARAATAERVLPLDEIMGSVAYVAPEQVRGERVDGRTDIYALGAVLYELLTGRKPFQGSSTAAVLTQRLESDPAALRSLNPRIPHGLEAVVLRALARAPERRYPRAAEMANALRAQVGRKLAASESETQVMPRPRITAWPTRRPSTSSPRRFPILVGAIVAVVLAAALATMVARQQPAFGTSRSQNVAPNLVGHRVSEVPKLLEQAGSAPGDTTVITRSVDKSHVGLIVDQQPQPGQPIEANAGLQIAVGVP